VSILDRGGPIVIAELSANHGGSLSEAVALVDLAARSGARCIKLQTFTPDSLTVRSHDLRFTVPAGGSPWDGKLLWDLFKEAQTPYAWHEELFEKARSLGLLCISSAFDEESVDLLVDLSVDAIKIASFELINIPLIRYAATSGLPIIISTGMATFDEVDEAVWALRDSGGTLGAILKCTSAYPAPYAELNLKAIPELKQRFGCRVGFSDHSAGYVAAATAIGLGATIFERHIAKDKHSEVLDASFSSDTDDFPDYVTAVASAYAALGDGHLHPTASEAVSMWERPSILALKDISAGQVLGPGDVGVRRPGHGGHPRDYQTVLGGIAKRAISRGDGVSPDDVEGS